MFKAMRRNMEKARSASFTEKLAAGTPEKRQTTEKEISFKESIGRDITPLVNNTFTRPAGFLRPRPLYRSSSADKLLERTEDVAEKGTPSSFEKIPEYLENAVYDEFVVNPSKRLYSSDFYVQAQVDLHGLARDEAKAVFDNFLQQSIDCGNRMLLIIHGRGLSSEGEPVLKNLVKDWLRRGPWKKWVLAFSSARAADGGYGATYVLLRRKPVGRVPRKRKRRHR